MEEFVKKQEVFQLTAKQKKQKVFSSVVAPPKGNLMIDLMIYDRFKYKNWQYILTAVDIHSRKAWVIPMTKKDEKASTDAVLKVFEKAGYVWPELQMDNAGEFTSKYFQDTMTKKGVKTLWYSEVGDIRKQSVVERFNRTLAEGLQKKREGTKNKDWPSYLDEVVDVYNRTEHGTIKATPDDVWDEKDTNKQTVVRVQHEFKVGDKVRVKVERKIFDKGDMNQFTRQIYRIKEKKGQKYVIENPENGNELARRYSGDELRLANEVQEPEVEDNKKKGEELDKAVDERKTEKKVKIQQNKLKNDSTSKFDEALQDLGGKRVRKAPKRFE